MDNIYYIHNSFIDRRNNTAKDVEEQDIKERCGGIELGVCIIFLCYSLNILLF